MLDSSIAILADRHTAVPVPRTPGTWEYEKICDAITLGYPKGPPKKATGAGLAFDEFETLFLGGEGDAGGCGEGNCVGVDSM